MLLFSFYALLRERIHLKELYIAIGVLLFLSLEVTNESIVDARYYSAEWEVLSGRSWTYLMATIQDYLHFELNGKKDIFYTLYAFVLGKLGFSYKLGMACWVVIMARLILEMYDNINDKGHPSNLYWLFIILGPHIFNGWRFWSAVVLLLYPIVTSKKHFLLALTPLVHISAFLFTPLIVAGFYLSQKGRLVLPIAAVIIYFTLSNIDLFSLVEETTLGRYENHHTRTSVLAVLASSSGIGLTFWVMSKLMLGFALLKAFERDTKMNNLFILIATGALIFMFQESLGNRMYRVALILSVFTTIPKSVRVLLFGVSAFFYILQLMAILGNVNLLMFLL